MNDLPRPVLDDGTEPASSDDLLERLAEIGARVTTTHHPAVFTVEEAKALRGELPGGHTKNLFLRNKKGRMWLVVCAEDRQVDLKQLAQQLGAGRFSFGSADRLMHFLGVIPGAVTPFSAINDHGGKVTIVLERCLLDIDPLNFHPLDNAMTTSIAPGDLVRFLEAVGHTPELIDL